MMWIENVKPPPRYGGQAVSVDRYDGLLAISVCINRKLCQNCIITNRIAVFANFKRV